MPRFKAKVSVILGDEDVPTTKDYIVNAADEEQVRQSVAVTMNGASYYRVVSIEEYHGKDRAQITSPYVLGVDPSLEDVVAHLGPDQCQDD